MLRSRVSNRMSRSRALSRASNQTKSKDPGASTSSQSNGQASFQNIAPINNQICNNPVANKRDWRACMGHGSAGLTLIYSGTGTLTRDQTRWAWVGIPDIIHSTISIIRWKSWGTISVSFGADAEWWNKKNPSLAITKLETMMIS